MDKNEETYRKEWRELLNKFSPEMKDKINTDPLGSRIFYALLYGDSPYMIIESLLKICEDDRAKIMELVLNQKIQYVLPHDTKLQ